MLTSNDRWKKLTQRENRRLNIIIFQQFKQFLWDQKENAGRRVVMRVWIHEVRCLGLCSWLDGLMKEGWGHGDGSNVSDIREHKKIPRMHI